jgi:hypothetical protein
MRLIVLLFFSSAIGCSRADPPTQAEPRADINPNRSTNVQPSDSSGAPKPAGTKEPRTLDFAAAKEVGEAFRANPVAAREKYRGVVWKFSGRVDQVIDSVTDGRVPVLVDVRLNDKHTTLALLRVSVAEVKQLARGRDAAFTGELADYEDRAVPPAPQFVFTNAVLK